ncbi:TPA: DUF551 domain-containing protein [Klebsiella oxytoca]
MTSKLTIEQAKRLRNDFECWQQDYDPKDDKEQYDMFGRGMAAMDMLIAGMYQEPVAWRVSFTQIGHESNNFTKTYWDEEEKDRWVKLHKMSGFKVNAEPLYTAPPVQAAMETEPVAYTDERNLGYIDRGRETAYLWGKQNSEASDVALYRHAQPAQVVPEEATPDSIEILASGRCRDHVVYQWDKDQRNAAADSWNACRAAMLAAADCSIPMISDRWIPVSERMPEGSEEVLCAKEFDGPGDWRKKVGYLLAGKWTVYGASWAPTHWMPLPAAPQEVKGE